MTLTVGAACGTDTDGVAGTTNDGALAAEPLSTATSAEPADAAAASSTVATAPAATVPAEPVPTREGLTMTAGWPYMTQSFDIGFAFAAPDDIVLGRWKVLFDTTNYLVLTFNQQSAPEASIDREEPGVVFFALPEGLTADDYVAGWQAYVAAQESFTVEQSDGEFLGAPALVLSGSYDLEAEVGGAQFARLSDEMNVPIAQGARSYLTYLIPVGERTLAVQINAHELDEDLAVTLVNQIVSSIEFS